MPTPFENCPEKKKKKEKLEQIYFREPPLLRLKERLNYNELIKDWFTYTDTSISTSVSTRKLVSRCLINTNSSISIKKGKVLLLFCLRVCLQRMQEQPQVQRNRKLFQRDNGNTQLYETTANLTPGFHDSRLCACLCHFVLMFITGLCILLLMVAQ